MIAYPTRSMLATMAKYPVSIRNDEMPTILVKNDFFHNRICTKPIETIEGHHFIRFKVIHVSSGA
jgi:hypothetical protein